MAVAIAEVAATGIDIGSADGLDAIAAQFIRWYDSKPADIGNQTRAVLSVRSESAAAMADRARAISGRKAGNGSLMRTAPVALSYLDDAEGARSAAHRISSLTHDDPRAGQACELWTHAIRHAVVAGNFDGVRGFLSVADQDVAEYWGPLLDQAETGKPAGLLQERLGGACTSDCLVGNHFHGQWRCSPPPVRIGSSSKSRRGHRHDGGHRGWPPRRPLGSVGGSRPLAPNHAWAGRDTVPPI